MGSIIFFGVGCIFIFIGYRIRKHFDALQAQGKKAEAVIVDFYDHESETVDGYKKVVQYPIVKFTDEDGIETTQELDATSDLYSVNKSLNIIYVKEGDEYHIMVDSKFWKSCFPSIFIVLGYILIAISVIWLVIVIWFIDALIN